LATLAVAAIGITVAGLLLDALQGPDPDPNNAAGGVVDNPWAWLSVVPDLSAGVVEEIVIVAVPVLVGRRAGWHPAVIIAVSMVLRWPFHIYHGAWSSLPWAMLWGGCYAAAFLYLRRLAPLIVFHAGYDAVIDLQSAYGDTGGTIAVIVGAVLLAGLALRIVPDRRRRLNPAAPTGDPAVARYLLTAGGRKSIAILTSASPVCTTWGRSRPVTAPDLLALPAADRKPVDNTRFPGLTAIDTHRVVYGQHRRVVLTHSQNLHEDQARSFAGTTLAKVGRQLDDIAATLARPPGSVISGDAGAVAWRLAGHRGRRSRTRQGSGVLDRHRAWLVVGPRGCA
jgi:hypothetical protein